MGKTKRKMTKKQQCRENQAVRQDAVLLRRQFNTCFEQGDYADVINMLAKIVESGQQTPEDLYRGAFSYFMVGDYARAAGMVSTVLSLAPENVDARILLARLCLLEDRAEDALAIFDFLFEHVASGFTAEQRDQLEDLLAYYLENEREQICRDFPHIAAHYHLRAAEGPETGDADKVATAVAEPAPAAAPEEVPSAPAEPAGSPCLVPGETLAAAPAEAATAGAETSETASVANAEEVATEERERVLSGSLSVVEKLRLLNAFAAGHFAAGEYAAAELLLSAAITLDTADAATLRNFAVLMKCSGDEERAVAFAAKLPQADFLLLAFLRNDG